MNILDIFTLNILEEEDTPEYIMEDPETTEIILYRRKTSPYSIFTEGFSKFRIFLVPSLENLYNYKSLELEAEAHEFILGSIEHISSHSHGVREGLTAAERHFRKTGERITRILYSSDLSDRIGPCYDWVSGNNIIKLRGAKGTIVALASNSCVGNLAIRLGEVGLASYGMMLFPKGCYVFTCK